MKKSLLIIFLGYCLLLFELHGQTTEIDSVENLLQKHTAKDTTRVNILNDVGYSLYSKDINKVFEYAEEAKNISIQISYTKGYAKSLNLIGIYYDETPMTSKF